MTSADYLIWPNTNQSPYACVLGDLTGFKDLYAMWEGKTMQGDFPSDVELCMSPDFPDNTVLTDNLKNKHNLIVVSERLKDFIEERGVTKIEYLQVAIRDHKSKVAAHYNIIHPLNSIDCLDYKASGALVSRALASHVISVKRLVLRNEMLDPERQLFRISGYPQIRLVWRDLAKAITTRFHGIEFRELDQGSK
jgi:hypothetical protein